MLGDIAFAGFLYTAEEWRRLEPRLRAQLLTAAFQRGTAPPTPPTPKPR
jgi:hypothetical protein